MGVGHAVHVHGGLTLFNHDHAPATCEPNFSDCDVRATLEQPMSRPVSRSTERFEVTLSSWKAGGRRRATRRQAFQGEALRRLPAMSGDRSARALAAPGRMRE